MAGVVVGVMVVVMSCPFVPRGTEHDKLHAISARCVARDLHTIAPGPLECKCWRQFETQRGDCKKISNCAFECDYYHYCNEDGVVIIAVVRSQNSSVGSLLGSLS